jgi:imidazolonepropionase-like amidohydrolase
MIKRRISSAVIATLIVLPVLSPPGAFAQTKRILPQTEASVFKCGLLIDPASGRTVRDAAIVTAGGKILWIGQAGSVRLPESFKVVDFSAKTVIPGLIDTHGHLFGGLARRHTTCELLAPLYLAAGVTTVRSPGSMEPEGDMGLTNRIDSGRLLGPRYFQSGPYIEGDPVTVGWMNPVRTPEEVRLKIEAWIKSGATSVKVYANMKGDLLRTAIEFGHLHGVKVIGHLGATPWKEAILMGIDELFHGILALPEITPAGDAAKDQKDPYGWLASVDLARPELQDILRLAAEARVVLTPTAVVLEPLDIATQHLDEEKRFLTPEAWAKIEERIAKPFISNGSQVMAKIKQFIKMAYDAGCVLSTGTDQVGFSVLPGYGLWREMEIFSEAGLPAMDVLRAATINGARAIGRSDLLGSLEAGKLADFVVLDGNPLEDIRRVRSVYRVVKGGIVFEPESVLKPVVGQIN